MHRWLRRRQGRVPSTAVRQRLRPPAHAGAAGAAPSGVGLGFWACHIHLAMSSLRLLLSSSRGPEEEPRRKGENGAVYGDDVCRRGPREIKSLRRGGPARRCLAALGPGFGTCAVDAGRCSGGALVQWASLVCLGDEIGRASCRERVLVTV